VLILLRAFFQTLAHAMQSVVCLFRHGAMLSALSHHLRKTCVICSLVHVSSRDHMPSPFSFAHVPGFDSDILHP
jgi:hypothetical protein